MSTPVKQHDTLQGTAPKAGPREWAALAVLLLPVLLVAVDGTVLTFALPEIAAALRPTATQQLWLVDAYPLVLAGLLVTAGSLGDRFGRRRLLLAGAAGFGLVSLLAATASSAEALIAARAALGLFGATLMPSTLALLRNVFQDRGQRRTALAVWAAGFSGGAALGPVVGGWLLEHHSWGAVFLINVPVMALLLVAGPLLLPESRDPAPGRLDLPSVGLSLAAAVPLVHGVKELAHHGATAGALVPLVLGAAAGWVFVHRQHRLEHPLLEVALFRIPVFRAAVLANLMSILALTGLLYCLSQHLQLVLGVAPAAAGMLLLPGLGVCVVAGFAAARLAQRTSLVRLVTVGLLLSAGGYALTATGTSTTGSLVLAFTVLCAGVGIAETLTNDAIVSTAPAERAGAASAISETAYELGAVLGTTLLGSLLNAVYSSRVDLPAGAAPHAGQTLGGAVGAADALGGQAGEALLASARAAFTTGVQVSAAAGAVLVLAAAVLVVVQLRPRR